MDPAEEKSLPLIRRRIPKIDQGSSRIEVFEDRLALSANPGVDLLLDALGMLQPESCVAEPLASPKPAFGELDAQTNDGGMQITSDFQLSNSAGSNSNLLSQAVDVRRDFGLSGSGQTIAVIDSGIAWDHVALGKGFGPGYRVVGGWDFAENDANPYDDAPGGFHGTHVAGIIGGNSNSLEGIAPGADLVGLRVFDDFGRSSLDWIESALQWVYNNRNAFESPITTVNLSIGALLPDSLSTDVQAQLDDELQQLRDGGIVVVAAAGNQFDSSAPDRLNYPASNINAWGVASSDGAGALSSFSQRNDSILAAPGQAITSAVPDHLLGRDGLVNDYYSATGTSMSAPQVAAASMLVREALGRVGETATPESIHQILQQTADRHLDPQTGHDFYAVNLSAAIASILMPSNDAGDANSQGGNNDLGSTNSGANDSGSGGTIQWGLPQDIGTVRWEQIELEPTSGVRATAARDGLFSIRAETASNDFVLRVTDSAGHELWFGKLPESGQIDVPVTEGETIIVHSGDSNAAADATRVLLANLIGETGGQLNLISGNQSPDVLIDLTGSADGGLRAEIGEFQYSFGAGRIIGGVLDGGDGADRIVIQGSEATTRLTLNPYADGMLSEGSLNLTLRGFEDVRFDGGGGADRVFLYDTRGDDILTARPGQAVLEGVGFRYEVTGVQRSYVHATSGGQDVAFLHDSASDDQLAVRPQFVSLRGNGFFNSVNGFEKVYAYSTSGGYDSADLYDTAGNDRMTASESSALITGTGYYVQARNFESVTGHSTAGGNDTATLYSNSSETSRWIRTNDQLTLRAADGAERTARGFTTLQAFESGVQVQVASWMMTQQSLPAPEFLTLEAEPERDEQPTTAGDSVLGFMAQLRRREQQVLGDLFSELGSERESESDINFGNQLDGDQAS